MSYRSGKFTLEWFKSNGKHAFSESCNSASIADDDSSQRFHHPGAKPTRLRVDDKIVACNKYGLDSNTRLYVVENTKHGVFNPFVGSPRTGVTYKLSNGVVGSSDANKDNLSTMADFRLLSEGLDVEFVGWNGILIAANKWGINKAFVYRVLMNPTEYLVFGEVEDDDDDDDY